MPESLKTVTMLLVRWRGGDRAALEELVPLVYAELHRLAGAYLRGERPGRTLSPTELVSEAYLRLAAGATPQFQDRVHFFAVAARTMRMILVDHARSRLADKRGGGGQAITFDEGLVAVSRPAELCALDDALRALADFDERKAKAIELFYFGGLAQEEIAAVLEVHVNTVARDLRLAEAWIHRYLRNEA